MAKKPKKIKITDKMIIKQLREEVQQVERNSEYWQKQYQEEKAERQALKSKLERHQTSIDVSLQAAQEEVKRLMEIIRWSINPASTQYPFRAEKLQRDGRHDPFNNGGY